MKRTLCLLLALIFVLALAPAVSADVIIEPQDSFFWDHRGECQRMERPFYADGPENVAVVYRSPESAAVVERVRNGEVLWISYVNEDENGISWGLCENFEDEYWMGWIPMDYLLLKYDQTAFQEEFADRIVEETGTLTESGAEVRFWTYPGSDDATDFAVEGDYAPEYFETFTDDAGRKWGHPGCLGLPGRSHRRLPDPLCRKSAPAGDPPREGSGHRPRGDQALRPQPGRHPGGGLRHRYPERRLPVDDPEEEVSTPCLPHRGRGTAKRWWGCRSNRQDTPPVSFADSPL